MRDVIDLEELSKTFSHLIACVDNAPAGTYEQAKAVRHIIGEHVDAMLKEFEALGITPSNSDGAYKVEAVIYDWVRNGTGSNGGLYTGEGFGRSMDGGELEKRVIAQAIASRDGLARIRADAILETVDQSWAEDMQAPHTCPAEKTIEEAPGTE